MRIELDPSLHRWMEAQTLARQQADRIRQFESEQAPLRRARWPVIVALAFGGIMLAAGVLLFVSAHWDELSPFYRMSLLVLAVGGFHVAGAFSLDRFRALGFTMASSCTVSLGGAIALSGLIFNMQARRLTVSASHRRRLSPPGCQDVRSGCSLGGRIEPDRRPAPGDSALRLVRTGFGRPDRLGHLRIPRRAYQPRHGRIRCDDHLFL